MMHATQEMGIFLSKKEIIHVKNKALRKGVWYKALNRIERACVDLVIKVVDRIRSNLLHKMLCSVVRKLQEAMRNPLDEAMKEIGSRQAARLSQIAHSWGNKSAVNWAKDLGFIFYLAITNMNALP